jgi:hypothetical protein
MVHWWGLTQREREVERDKRWKGYGENKAGVSLQTSSTMLARRKSSTMFTNYGKVERVWDEDRYVFPFLYLSLSLCPPIFLSCACRWPSTVFLLCYVNCDMPSFLLCNGQKGRCVCVCAGGVRPRVGAVLVPFVFLRGEILSTGL